MKLEKSFSQFGEDTVAAECFPDGFTGRVLEIGAWQPETFSNSRAFILAGWKAVLIDPAPGSLQDLMTEYSKNPNVTVVQAAIGLPKGPRLVEMMFTHDAVSTSDSGNYEQWKGTVKYYGQSLVATLPLDHISLQFGHFDVVSIDAEGQSVDLFVTAIFELRWRPKIFIVEYDKRIEEVLKVATASGYAAIHVNGTNVVLEKKQ